MTHRLSLSGSLFSKHEFDNEEPPLGYVGKEIHFDDVFDYVGHFELFQILTFLVLGTMGTINGMQDMSSVFIGADVDHWCHVPRLANFSYDQQKYIAIPLDSDSESDGDEYERCLMFDLDWNGYTDSELVTWNRSSLPTDTPTVSCDSVVFDKHTFHSTIGMEWNLVCGEEWQIPLSTSVYLSGIFVGGVLAGIFSDKFGRMTTIILCNLLHFVASASATLSPNIAVFMVLRFLTSLAINGSFVTSFVLLAETCGPRHRTTMSLMLPAFWSTGFMTLVLIAIFIRGYVKLQVAVTASAVFTLFYYWVLPESPRWLLAQGRRHEAMSVLRKIASINGKTYPDNLWIILDSEKESSLTDLVKYPFLRIWTFIFCSLW